MYLNYRIVHIQIQRRRWEQNCNKSVFLCYRIFFKSTYREISCLISLLITEWSEKIFRWRICNYIWNLFKGWIAWIHSSVVANSINYTQIYGSISLRDRDIFRRIKRSNKQIFVFSNQINRLSIDGDLSSSKVYIGRQNFLISSCEII